MNLRLGLLALSCLAAAGCGLTLDYDPPPDGGVDAPVADGGACGGGCPTGRRCHRGVCRLECSGDVCHDDPGACEACVGGLCLPADPTCGGGSACAMAACDPMDDVCRTTSSCRAGLSCVDGECVPGACSTDDECLELVDDCGEAYTCGGDGTCTPRERPVCLPIAGSCAVVDPCTCGPSDEIDPALCSDDTICDETTGACVDCLEDGDCDVGHCHPERHQCVECAADDQCATGQVCDPSSFTCVQCYSGDHCIDLGLAPICDPTTSTCVECLGDGDCFGRTAPYCEDGICIACRSNADCLNESPICGADGTCHPCAAGDDCGPNAHCELGMCEPNDCSGDGECPSRGCALGSCDEGRCTFALDDAFCQMGAPGDDGVDCTVDSCEPSSGSPDGCVHRPVDTLCPDDGFSCTIERCAAGGPTTGADLGCVHIRNDALCNSASGAFECALGVCAAGEPRAIVDATTGCGLTYEPNRCVLGIGSYCDASGQCEPSPTCGPGRECPNDGIVCNGTLRCSLGLCVAGPDLGLDHCLGTPICRTYCATTGCEVRTDPPPGLMCSAIITLPGTDTP